MTPPRVFISYAWGDEDAWVEEFATRLRADGIDARLDKWELAPGDEIAVFMERQVRESAFVLFICTPKFREKADARKGGVGYEAMIATAEVLAKRDEVARKYIPVHRSGAWEAAAPSWLLGRYRIDLANERCFEASHTDLLATLLGRRVSPPPLGVREPTTQTLRAAPTPAERADRVRDAMRAHGMSRQYEEIQHPDGSRVFRFCDWPPPSYADADGYSEIFVERQQGPGDCTATGSTDADVFRSAVPALDVFYSFGSQGAYDYLPPLRVWPGDVVRVWGGAYDGENGRLPFYPPRDSAVVLRSGRYLLDRVRAVDES